MKLLLAADWVTDLKNNVQTAVTTYWENGQGYTPTNADCATQIQVPYPSPPGAVGHFLMSLSLRQLSC